MIPVLRQNPHNINNSGKDNALKYYLELTYVGGQNKKTGLSRIQPSWPTLYFWQDV